MIRTLLHPEVANCQHTLRLFFFVRVCSRDLLVYRRTVVGVGGGVPAEVVWGTVVDSREQRPGTQTLEHRWTLLEDRTLGLQRAHRTRPRLCLERRGTVVVGLLVWATVVVGLLGADEDQCRTVEQETCNRHHE